MRVLQGWQGPFLRAAEEPLEVVVECRTKRRVRGRRHPVTLSRDWQVETGHDLDLERIGMALGGYQSCVELADHVLPAARDTWLHRLRRVPPAMHRQDENRWLPADPVPGCCETAVWTEPEQAVAHLSTASHWSLRHRSPIQATLGFLRRLDKALGFRHEATREQVARRAAGSPLDPGMLARAWAFGLPPEVVLAVHREVAPGGEMLPLVVLRQVAGGTDPGWLRQFTDLGPVFVAWAAQTWGERDLADADLRRRWLEAGILPADAAVVLDRRPDLALGDLVVLSVRTGQPVRRVAAVAAAWARLGTGPDHDDLAVLLAHEHLWQPRIGTEAIESLVRRHRHRSDPVDATVAGLLIGWAGTVARADRLISAGVRSLSAAAATV